jgi:LPXTG-motif cell wall-anchored protein
MKNKNIFIAIGAVLVAAAGVFFLTKKKDNSTEKPPKKAPQLDIDNPGTQAEFPTTASESELG